MLWLAIRIDSADAEMYYNRAEAYGAKGEYDKAIADFTEAIRLDPQNSVLYARRAIAHREVGDDLKAAKDEGKALELSN